ncbi:MAG: SDR family oxidoreductase [Rhodospirillales bacterium]|nr:SDR family oxidoreductase [Rhodospirillales bacterium]
MGRIALVTGGARGIGESICQALAESGVTLAVADLDHTAAQRRADTLPGSGHRGWAMDVSDESHVESVFDHMESHHGPVSILVCNAGILILKEGGVKPMLTEISLEEWERTHAVNLRGTFLCCRAYLRRRQIRPVADGRIVTLSSSAAQLGGYRSSCAYISSKAAVLGLTKGMAREAAPLGITVNAVAPGLIDAPMTRLSLKPEDDAQAAAPIPMGRIGRPADVAGAVRYLCSPEAGYLTGVTIDVNGGTRMQ